MSGGLALARQGGEGVGFEFRASPIRKAGRFFGNPIGARISYVGPEAGAWSFYNFEPRDLLPKPRLRGLIRLGRSFEGRLTKPPCLVFQPVSTGFRATGAFRQRLESPKLKRSVT